MDDVDPADFKRNPDKVYLACNRSRLLCDFNLLGTFIRNRYYLDLDHEVKLAMRPKTAKK